MLDKEIRIPMPMAGARRPGRGADTIFLRGVRVEALIGVCEHERHAPSRS